MENKFIFTIPYKDLHLWDVKRYSKNVTNSKYVMEYLGKHIIHQTNKLDLSKNPNDKFNILGISNEIGMYDAYAEEGKKFNQSYKIVKDNFIAYNPYRVNVGSIGIKKEQIGNLISPAYVVFNCKKTLLPEYLFLLMKTKWFNERIKENTSGSVRQNLTFNALSNIKIPVPELIIQKELVSNYNKKINRIDVENNLYQEFQQYFSDILEVKDNKLQTKGEYFFGTVRSSSLSRWDSWKNSTDFTCLKYKIVPFIKVVDGSPQYGANVKGVDKFNEYRYIRITDINEDGTLNEEIKYPEFVEEKFILKEDDFLIARSGNTVGKTFLVTKENCPKSIYAGYLVRYRLKKDIIYPKYLFYYTKSKMFKNWVFANQRISGQPNINGQEYLDFPLILPPYEIQMQIANKSEEFFNNIIKVKNDTINIYANAKEEFEKAIFN